MKLIGDDVLPSRRRVGKKHFTFYVNSLTKYFEGSSQNKSKIDEG